jgi:hypothetical protein
VIIIARVNIVVGVGRPALPETIPSPSSQNVQYRSSVLAGLASRVEIARRYYWTGMGSAAEKDLLLDR